MTQILEVLSGRFWAILSGFSFRTPQSSSSCRDFWPGPSGAGFVSGFAEAPARFEFFTRILSSQHAKPLTAANR